LAVPVLPYYDSLNRDFSYVVFGKIPTLSTKRIGCSLNDNYIGGEVNKIRYEAVARQSRGTISQKAGAVAHFSQKFLLLYTGPVAGALSKEYYG